MSAEGLSTVGQRRIALAQIAPLLGNRSRNLQLHARHDRASSSRRADLVVFPELSLTGYFLRDMVPDVACPAAPEIARLCQAAGDMDVVFGFVEQSPAAPLLQQRGLCRAGGPLRHVHRKVYLPTYGLFDEQRYFAAGDRLRAFDTAAVRPRRAC